MLSFDTSLTALRAAQIGLRVPANNCPVPWDERPWQGLDSR